MPTGTSSLRKTKRRGVTLVAACAAALAAALTGPAWAGPVPQPDDPPAGPRGQASPQIAEAPTKASSPEARATRFAGTEASTPTPDAPLAAPKTHATPKADAHPAAAKRKVTPRRAPRPAPTSTATPQPAPTYGSTATVPTATHAPAAAPHGARLRRSRTASGPTGEERQAKKAAPARDGRLGARATATASACRSAR